MLHDPYVTKRSDLFYFLTKLKYLHVIEAVDIGPATYPDCKQAVSKVNPVFIWEMWDIHVFY